MKTVYLLRHAKSDWSDPELGDFDRTLNKRGEKDAPRMGAYLGSAGTMPDVILSSPAIRARSTAGIVAETLGFKDQIRFVKELYEFENTGVYFKQFAALPDTVSCVLAVGHNPALEMLVSEMTSAAGMNVKIPTAGLVCLSLEIETWKEIKPSIAVLNWMAIPKALPHF